MEATQAAVPSRTAATGEPVLRGRGAGIALMVTSAASNQTGAAIGVTAFPVIGPVGVVAVRQLVTATVLMLTVRPRLRGLRRDQWWPIIGLAIVFGVMNLSLYAAIERIGLGLAVTLEFLGPLTVAILGSRRLGDGACAILAGIGVVVLTDPGPTTDVLGVSLALLAAIAWGSYVLLNRTLGRRLPGLHGTAAASLFSAGVWTPIAIVWFASHAPTGAALAAAIVCGVMSSIVPYVTDLLALRRIPAQVFGTFTSINPVLAALAGWLLLHQAPGVDEWLGIGLIVASNAVVTARAGTPAASKGATQARAAVLLDVVD